MQFDSGNQISLQRYGGNVVTVNGESVDPGAAGFTRLQTANLITAAGADAGAPPVAATTYYVYVSNSSATFSPLSIRLCATAPTLVNGVKYLGAAGNALNWRFVGWVRLVGGPFFADDRGYRWTVNYYNRRPADLFRCPNYVDDNATTGWTTGSTVWEKVNGPGVPGGDLALNYIANGEDAVELHVSAVMRRQSLPSASHFVGLGLDSVTDAVAGQWTEADVIEHHLAFDYAYTPTEGAHTADILVAVSAQVGTFYADLVRLGAAADPATTFISGTVMV